MKSGIMILAALLVCGAVRAEQNTGLDGTAEVRNPVRLKAWLEANAADAESRIATVETGVVATAAAAVVTATNASTVASAAAVVATNASTVASAAAVVATNASTVASAAAVVATNVQAQVIASTNAFYVASTNAAIQYFVTPGATVTQALPGITNVYSQKGVLLTHNP